MKILTYGTFDTFHIGHLNLLKRLSAMGQLHVGISTDEFNQLKGKRALMSYEDRHAIVGAIRYVDLAFPEHNWEQKVEDIRKYEIDVFAIGDDWEGKFDHLKAHCQVLYMPRTQHISSTIIKEMLSEISNERKSILATLAHAEDLIRGLED